ncbi:lymphocyte antigen 6 complex locus protein G5c [Oryctolagus cuniculus]|uniref:lymphocyte antigen 6 complex locus protein G5c n=1 Tax=Oryctolagus cuniculus TaxID=9986 RepID=UPI00048DE7E3|nr:lymphocyte antigen 6 complex locus protein G5c [Oryctolagus cuniculus]
MHLMAGPAGGWRLGLWGLSCTSQGPNVILLTALIMMSLMCGECVAANQDLKLPKYLRCYRCLLETKELGCLLGSDICLAAVGSSCVTLHIRNSSGSDVMVSDCRSKEQLSDCTHTRPSSVFGFWIYAQCCFLNFCNNPQNRAKILLQGS